MSPELCEAVQVMRDGGVICHACEGVWGFACDPFNESAVQRILSIKHRSQSKGLIVIAHVASQFEPELSRLLPVRRAAVEASWPGRTTWLLPTNRFPTWIVGDFDSVAARVPGHAQARALAALFKRPMVSTSANVANEAPCLHESEARTRFGDAVDCTVSGTINQEIGPSNIFDALTGDQIR